MSDFDKQLTIRITTAADTAGLKQTLDALKAVSDATKKVTPAAGENSPTLGLPGLGANDGHDSGGSPAVNVPLAKTFPQPAPDALAGMVNLVVAAFAGAVEKLLELSARIEAAHNLSARNGKAPGNQADRFQPPVFDPDNLAHPVAPDSSASSASAVAGNIAEAMDHGQNINAEQNALLSSLSGLLSSIHSSTKDVLAVIKQGRQDQQYLQREISELKRSLAQINTNTRNSGNPTPP